MRKRSSTPVDQNQALTDVELIKKWDHGNAMFKFMDRYQYFQLIGDLEAMTNDNELTDDEAQNMLKMLSSTEGAIK